jgi:AcrR family transcriptional regulator
MPQPRAHALTDQAPSRDAPGTGGPRSEPTRRAILDAARKTFAARGFEQTTIRAIAAQAGIDPSMVMRYFGSKAGLFAAASVRNLEVPDLRPVPRDERGEFLVRHFVDRWEQTPGHDTLVFLLRTAATNEAVAAQLQGNLNELITRPLAAAGHDRVERRASLIATQLLGLALCRYVLHLEPTASASAEQAIADVAPAVQLYLDTSARQLDAARKRRPPPK